MRLPRMKALLASAAILASVHVAEAQFATEFTQLLNNAQLVQHGAEQLQQSAQFAQQITNQVQQIQNQLQMYQNMLQNTATLPTRIWGQAQADLAQLVSLTQQGQSLAYGMSNIDDVFRQRFGTYDFSADRTSPAARLASLFVWSATQRDTIASTLKTANLTADQITSDGTILRQLQAQSESADGQMRALQIGHSLASVQADQMMKLRALIAQQTVMFGEVFGRKQAIEEQQQAIEKKYFKTETALISPEERNTDEHESDHYECVAGRDCRSWRRLCLASQEGRGCRAACFRNDFPVCLDCCRTYCPGPPSVRATPDDDL